MEFKRDFYLNKLINDKGDHLIKIITGIRRCGKSYLLDPIFKNYLIDEGVKEDHIIKLDLDERFNKKYLDPDVLDEYIRGLVKDDETYYILLDEVQKVPDFESVLIGFLHKRNLDIYITGSNSRFLSSDIITEFRGRGEEIRLYPLSFSEFMSCYNGDKVDGWNEYCTYGGLPLVVEKKNDEGKSRYLTEQVNNIYINDVIERNKIKNDHELKELIQIISSSIGSLSNPKKLENSFKSMGKTSLDHKTIDSYLRYLEESFIIERATRYDVKGKKYISTPYKFYFTDMGIRNSLINYRQAKEQTHIMENIIYLELRRRGFSVDVGIVNDKTIINNKDEYKQYEVDFVANKGDNRYYIQSAYGIPDSEKEEQEERSLRKINDSFKKFIIVGDNIHRTRTQDGIIVMNVYDFLLDDNSLNY